MNQKHIDRYNELRDIVNNQGYKPDTEEYQEYLELCEYLLRYIMAQNKDVFQRLKDR